MKNESKLVFLSNSRSKRDVWTVFFGAAFFVLIYSIVHSKYHMNAWWILVFGALIIFVDLLYRSKSEIVIYEDGQIIIKNLIPNWNSVFLNKDLYFYVKIGESKSLANQVLILRLKQSDKLIFRIPINSEKEYLDIVSLLTEKVKIKRINNYGGVHNIRPNDDQDS
jgi:hypothetical protein